MQHKIKYQQEKLNATAAKSYNDVVVSIPANSNNLGLGASHAEWRKTLSFSSEELAQTSNAIIQELIQCEIHKYMLRHKLFFMAPEIIDG